MVDKSVARGWQTCGAADDVGAAWSMAPLHCLWDCEWPLSVPVFHNHDWLNTLFLSGIYMRSVPLEGILSSEENVDRLVIGLYRLQELRTKPYRNKAGNVILVNNQPGAFFRVLIYFISLHVSSNPVLIIRRKELNQYIISYVSLCVGDCLVCQAVIYTEWYIYVMM